MREVSESDAVEIAVCPNCGVSLHGAGGESYVHVVQTWMATLDERGVVCVQGDTVDTTCTCATCDGIIDPDEMEWL